MNKFTKFIGMDVDKATIAVSVADEGCSDVRYLGEIANTAEAIVKLVKQLRKGDPQLSFCYQAGPCGYGIHRQLTELVQPGSVEANFMRSLRSEIISSLQFGALPCL